MPGLVTDTNGDTDRISNGRNKVTARISNGYK